MDSFREWLDWLNDQTMLPHMKKRCTYWANTMRLMFGKMIDLLKQKDMSTIGFQLSCDTLCDTLKVMTADAV